MIQLAPPLIIGQKEFDEIRRILRSVLTEAWSILLTSASVGGRRAKLQSSHLTTRSTRSRYAADAASRPARVGGRCCDGRTTTDSDGATIARPAGPDRHLGKSRRVLGDDQLVLGLDPFGDLPLQPSDRAH